MAPAKFVTGSTMRHVLVMTSTASIGLAMMFLVDLADIYFLSLLGEVEVTSAVGFGGTIIFFTFSITIGLMIAMGALVSRSVGARRMHRARRYSTNILVYGLLLTVATGGPIWLYSEELLSLLGASGRTLELADLYLSIVVATMPAIGVSMCLGGILRGVGDAKRSMYVSIITAVTNAVLDPILIFGFDMGIEGAAWATAVARILGLVYGLYVVFFIHRIIAPFHFKIFRMQVARISSIAFPAILTNIATPVAASYMIYMLSQFGDGAVAGMSIITRLAHVMFCGLFALSGAIGPILGQNLGARHFDRIRQVLKDSFLFTGIYVLVVAAILFLSKGAIISAFGATGGAASIIDFYSTWIAIAFFFAAALFIANTTFNNLGKPSYSAYFNWGRATVGTVPFAYFGAEWYGANGVLAGQAIGGVVFAIGAFLMTLRYIKQLEQHYKDGNALPI